MSTQHLQRSLQVADACSNLEERLQTDPSAGAELYLAQRPEWAADPDAALDLIYTEYVTRCQIEQRRLAADLCGRFPQHATELRRQMAFDEFACQAARYDSRPQQADSTLTSDHSESRTIRAAVDSAALVGGRYELLREIGRGGAGVVYSARQLDLDRIVALKLLSVRMDRASSLGLRLSLEGTVIGRLQHVNILQVFEIGETDGRAYLALEYCEGGTLAKRIAGSWLPAREAATLLRTLAMAIDAAHLAGIVHRDLKPANILFTADGVPKIADFGLAKLVDDEAERTRTGAILGTPAYMAPEQISETAAGVTPAADVYALGAILYELLAGRPPFVAATSMEMLQRVQNDEPVSLRRLAKKLPRDLETICLKCLRKAPHDRYATAAALAGDLQRFLDGKPVAARPIGWSSRLVRQARRRPAVWALAVTLLVSLVAGSSVAAWKSYRLTLQREATDAAFGTAFQRWHSLFLTARRGAETTAGTVPLADSRRAEIANEFKRFLDRYADEVPIRHDVVYGYSALASYHRQLGDGRQFQLLAAQAISKGRRLIHEAELFPASRQHVAGVHYHLAMLDGHRGQNEQSLEGYRRAANAARELLNSGQAILKKDVHITLAQSHYRIASRLKDSDPSSAIVEYETAGREFRAIAAEWPDDIELQLRLARCLLSQSDCLLELDRIDDVQRVCDESAQLCDFLQELRRAPEICLECANIYNKIGQRLFRGGFRQEALSPLEQAISLLEQSLTEQPNLVAHRRRLAQLQFHRGSSYHQLRQPEEAIAAYCEALAHYDCLAPENRHDEDSRWLSSARKRFIRLRLEQGLPSSLTLRPIIHVPVTPFPRLW